MKGINGFLGKEFTPQAWNDRCKRSATEKELAWQSELGKRELVDMHAKQQAQLDRLRSGNWKGKEARLTALQNALHAQHAAEAAAIRERHVREIQALRQIQGAGSQRLTPTKDIRDFKGKTFTGKDGKKPVTVYREKWSIRNSFIDDGKGVTVLAEDDPRAILAAMQITLQKYGEIRVAGDEAFQRLCILIAARNGLQLANRELQAAVDAERKRISEMIQQRTAASGQQRQDPAPASPGTFPGMGPGRDVPSSTPRRAPQATPAAPAQDRGQAAAQTAQEQQARHTAESVKASAAEIARGRAMMLSRHELEKLDAMRDAQAVGRAQAWPRPITDAHMQQVLDRLYETHAREAEAFTRTWGVDPYLHMDQDYVREQEVIQARFDAARIVDVMNLRATLDRRGVEAEGIEEAARLKEEELRERYALETAALQLQHSQSPVIQQARTAAGIDTSIPQAVPMPQVQAQGVTGERGGIEAPREVPAQPVAMAATANPEKPLVPAVKVTESYSSDPFLGDTFSKAGVSALTEPALRAAAKKAGLPHERLKELEDAGKLVRVEDGEGTTKFTTPEIRDMETRLVGTAEAMAGKTFYGVPERVADEVATHYTLSDDQREVFDHIRNGNHSCAVVRGLAGTGKSHTLKAVNEACQRSGIKMLGCAPSGLVAEDMQKSANIESFTNHALLGRIEKGEIALNDHTMIVMDEAGMTDSVRMARIIESCYRNNSKLVLVGDAEQLQPVGLGGPMRSIQDRIGYAELTEIRRQKSEVDREMVRRLSEKDAAGAIEMMEQRGQIETHKHTDGVMRGVADGYVEDMKAGRTVLALASQVTQVTELNTVLRERMQQEGLVSRDEYPFRAQNKEGMHTVNFAKGDRIICGKNDYQIDVRNGSVGTVDRAEDGKIWVRFDSDKESTKLLKQSDYPNVEYAYAMTVHKSQGKTVDSVHYAFGSFCNCNIAYVASSRHKESFKLHCTEDQRTKLEAAFMKDNSKDTVADYTPIQRPEQTKAAPAQQVQQQQTQRAGIQTPEVDPRVTAAQQTQQTQAPQQDPGSRVPAQDYTPEAVAAQQMPTPETQETAPVRFAAQENEQFMGAEKARAMAVQAMHANELAAARNQVLQDRQEQGPADQQEPARETAAPAQPEQQMPEKATMGHDAPAQPAQEAAPFAQEPVQAPQTQEMAQDSPEVATTPQTGAQEVGFVELPMDEPVQPAQGQGQTVEASAQEQTPPAQPEFIDLDDIHGKPQLPENALGKVGQEQGQQAPARPEQRPQVQTQEGTMAKPQAPEQAPRQRPELPPNALGQIGQPQAPAQEPQGPQKMSASDFPELPENHLGKVDTGGPKPAQEAPGRAQGDNGRPELPPNALGQAATQGGPQQAPPEQREQPQGLGYV